MAAIEVAGSHNIRRHFSDLQRLRRTYRQKRRKIISRLIRVYRLPNKSLPRNLASSTLPVELLLDIFSLAIAADDAHESIQVHKSASWIISRVCSRWRAIALATPVFWSRLSIDTAFDAEWTDGKISLLKEVLARSAGHPLQVVCAAEERCVVPSLLQPHTSQLVVLEITTDDFTDLTDLYRLSQMDLPLLEIFQIEVESTTTHIMELPSSTLSSSIFGGIWFNYAPRLWEIRLRGMPIHALLPWAQIRVFSGSLHGWEEFFILFNENSAIEEAHITFYESNIPLRRPIIVSSLRELTIATLSFLPFIAFAFPNLRMLRLAESDSTFGPTTSSIFDGDFHSESRFIRTFLSNTQLETLILDTYVLSPSILLPILRSCPPQLKVLYFSVDEDTASEVYAALTYGNSPLVPYLRELYIQDVTDSYRFPLRGAFRAERLLAMIQSRVATGLQELILSAPQSTKSVASRHIMSALGALDGLELTVHWGYRWLLHKYGTVRRC